MERSLEFFGDRNQYNASKHVWRLGNQRVEFGHMERVGTPAIPGDEVAYAGAPYDFIGFDQLEQFPQYAYEFMLSRARTTTKGQRVRMVASANPAGEFVDWIIARWAPWLDETHPDYPDQPGRLRYYKRDAEGVEVETTASDPDGLSRTFIPAKLSDNPFLGDDYRRALNLLPEPLRSALLHGNWAASITDDAYQVIPRAWVKAAQARWTKEPPRLDDGAIYPLTVVGVDVARGGADKTVFSLRRGRWFAPLKKYPGRQTPDGPSVKVLLLKHLGGEKPRRVVNVDVIGIGASAYDSIKGHLPVDAINFGEGADYGDGMRVTDKSGTLEMANVRAWAYWSLRESLDPVTGDNLALPPDSELLGDLCAPRWRTQKQRIYIESKDEIIKRLRRSPDCGDAIALSHFSGAIELPQHQPTHASRWAQPSTADDGRADWNRYR